MSETPDIEAKRKERGAQLRALIVSWDESKTFVDALREQQAQIDAGTFAPSDEWSIAADEILGFYMSRPRLTAWDEKEAQKKREEDRPRIVIP